MGWLNYNILNALGIMLFSAFGLWAFYYAGSQLGKKPPPPPPDEHDSKP